MSDVVQAGTYNDTEVYPISQTGREADGELYNVQDGSAEIRDKFEYLVLVLALQLIPSECGSTLLDLRAGQTLLDVRT